MALYEAEAYRYVAILTKGAPGYSPLRDFQATTFCDSEYMVLRGQQ